MLKVGGAGAQGYYSGLFIYDNGISYGLFRGARRDRHGNCHRYGDQNGYGYTFHYGHSSARDFTNSIPATDFWKQPIIIPHAED